MTATTNGDLHRDMGRMEGKQDAMGDRLDRLEKLVSEGFERMDERLARIEAADSSRKGVIGVIHWIAGLLGGAAVLIIQHFWR